MQVVVYLYQFYLFLSCGTCVGGNTGKAEDFGMDLCGVCAGDNTSCVGCDGVPNSGKVFDECGDCLLISDPGFNTACTKLSRMKSQSGPMAGGTRIIVEGGGFGRVNVAKCKFEPAAGGAG